MEHLKKFNQIFENSNENDDFMELNHENFKSFIDEYKGNLNSDNIRFMILSLSTYQWDERTEDENDYFYDEILDDIVDTIDDNRDLVEDLAVNKDLLNH